MLNHPQHQLKLLFIGSLISMSLWTWCQPARAALEPKPSDILPIQDYQATYVVSWHGIRGGESVHQLKTRRDGNYHISTTSVPYLKVLPFRYVEKTDFKYQQGKIYPKNYYYNIKEGNRRKQGNVFFDWQKQTVSNTVSHEPWQAQISDDLQDKLTHAMHLRLDLMQKPLQQKYVYTVAEDDEIKPYSFTVLGDETLNTALGTLPTLKVELFSKQGRKTHMWLSKSHNYMPVAVNHYKEGKKVGSGEIKSYQPTNNQYN